MNYKQGDVFLTRLSPSKGNEPGKDRPSIVIQSNNLNEVGYPTCIIVPCSSLNMPETAIRPILNEEFFKKKTYALLDQVRTVDVSKRFLKKIGTLSSENLELVIKSLKNLIST